jgi:hypothetical protein
MASRSVREVVGVARELLGIGVGVGSAKSVSPREDEGTEGRKVADGQSFVDMLGDEALVLVDSGSGSGSGDGDMQYMRFRELDVGA